jgi:hypothetical protein
MVKKGKSRKKVKNTEKKLDKLARTLAKATLGLRKVRDNFWHWCEVCQEPYCNDFKGGDMFCENCYYLNSCIKVMGENKVCLYCGGERKYV